MTRRPTGPREKILAAAMTMLGEGAATSLGVRAVAARAGVSGMLRSCTSPASVRSTRRNTLVAVAPLRLVRDLHIGIRAVPHDQHPRGTQANTSAT